MWTKYISNPESIKSIFGSIPDLSEIELMEVTLPERNVIILRFNVIPYPESPPKKWTIWKNNTVQITASIIEPKQLRINNWLNPVNGILLASKNKEKIDFIFKSNGCTISFNSEFEIYINKIDPYQDERRQ